METGNNKGQILVEVGVVMIAFAFIFFAGFHELSKQKRSYQKYQFTQEKEHVQKNRKAHQR